MDEWFGRFLTDSVFFLSLITLDFLGVDNLDSFASVAFLFSFLERFLAFWRNSDRHFCFPQTPFSFPE